MIQFWNCKINNSSMNIFFLATIFGLYFSILFLGVKLEIKRNIFPFLLRYFLACFRNFIETSSPRLPPVVASWESLGSRLSLGRYGALKVIRLNFPETFEKRFVFLTAVNI